ncbi:MAG: hypothetical protein CME43_08735 [Haliea sp.]|jgi:hypothetical protein|uniref:hypothetical protein n=1 Tax=Haliea sp. TaxID=1932666 RepID=UPI000C5D2214|nr:hypothetical protein [Haliea sp.]MBM69548.1 hypothetical protein [Haliea sp.]|tara:strand:- start:72376 stop:72648 length:273 start_codon:yes stop_codon:yes gene_type:complete
MQLVKIATVSALLALSSAAFAAKPTSIVFQGNHESNTGAAYSEYLVKCSNGKTATLTAWENRRKWCAGNELNDSCERKQIKAAKAACNAL